MLKKELEEMFERVYSISKKDFPDRVQHFTSLLLELRTTYDPERKINIETELCAMYMHKLE